MALDRPGTTAGGPGPRVTGFIDVENAIAADPVMDLAKTESYSIRGNRAKWDGRLAGYTEAAGTQETGLERIPVCALYHALELWDWFASLGRSGALYDLARDMRAIVGN